MIHGMDAAVHVFSFHVNTGKGKPASDQETASEQLIPAEAGYIFGLEAFQSFRMIIVL